MLIHKISYIDLNGVTCEDTLYFNLSKVDIAKLQVKGDGTFIDQLKGWLKDKKIENVFNFFYNLVLDSYGEKSEDGKRFIRTPEMRKQFEESRAFDEFFADVISTDEKMTNFVRAVIPYTLPEDIPDVASIGSGDGAN